MNFKGTIIEESLQDKSIFDVIKTISTEVETVTEDHKTPWLSQWTLRTVEIEESQADEVAERISHAFETEHATWYADFKNDTIHYIIFPEKIFKVDRTKKEEYDEVVTYGVSRGIPQYQLDFSPDIQPAMEFLDILNEKGEVTGQKKTKTDVHRDGDWHKTVHIWVVNKNGEVLLQKRGPNMDSYPNMWDISSAGHVSVGESSVVSAQRELKEELGIDAAEKDLKFLFTVSQKAVEHDTYINNEINDVYLYVTKKSKNEFVLQKSELADIKFVALGQLEGMVKNKSVELLWHLDEYEKLFPILHSYFDTLQITMTEKKLQRSRTDRILFGVCGGLAHYFSIDAVLVRIVFALLVFANGIGLLLYVILLIIMPLEPGEAVAIDRAQKAREFADEIGNKAREFAHEFKQGAAPATVEVKNEVQETKDGGGRYVLGIIIVVIGLFMLFDRFFPFYFQWLSWAVLWPLILIGVGIYLIVKK